MLKRFFVITFVLVLVLFLGTACGSNDATNTVNNTSEPPVSQSNNVTPTSTPVPVIFDLSGGWKQTNSNSETSYQIAMITDGIIEIYWKNEEDNSMALYWSGTYISPATYTDEYSWNSIKDKNRTDRALLASGDDEKTFTYKDGIISYSVSIMGVTTTVEIIPSDDVDIQVPKTVSTDELNLELLDSGYAIKKGSDKFYIQYALIVKNPSTEMAVEFPEVRITARDENGAILGTEDIVGGQILPGGVWYSAFQGPSADSEPATVDFELIQPDSYNWISPDLLDYVGEPLTVENPIRREDKIVGEVVNPNDFDIESVAVVVLFRDENGELLAGETTYTSKAAADSKTPFELFLWGDEDYITDNFEVYAYPWY